MKEKRKPSQLWYTPEYYALVQAAAKLARRPMTTFAILATLAAAKEVLRKEKTDD